MRKELQNNLLMQRWIFLRAFEVQGSVCVMIYLEKVLLNGAEEVPQYAEHGTAWIEKALVSP